MMKSIRPMCACLLWTHPNRRSTSVRIQSIWRLYLHISVRSLYLMQKSKMKIKIARHYFYRIIAGRKRTRWHGIPIGQVHKRQCLRLAHRKWCPSQFWIVIALSWYQAASVVSMVSGLAYSPWYTLKMAYRKFEIWFPCCGRALFVKKECS